MRQDAQKNSICVESVISPDVTAVSAAMPAHYAAALSAWRRRVMDARRQATAWQLAAAVSMLLCVGLASLLLLTPTHDAVALQVVQSNTSSGTRTLMATPVAPWDPTCAGAPQSSRCVDKRRLNAWGVDRIMDAAPPAPWGRAWSPETSARGAACARRTDAARSARLCAIRAPCGSSAPSAMG
jgi:hypothetical protein